MFLLHVNIISSPFAPSPPSSCLCKKSDLDEIEITLVLVDNKIDDTHRVTALPCLSLVCPQTLSTLVNKCGQ